MMRLLILACLLVCATVRADVPPPWQIINKIQVLHCEKLAICQSVSHGDVDETCVHNQSYGEDMPVLALVKIISSKWQPEADLVDIKKAIPSWRQELSKPGTRMIVQLFGDSGSPDCATLPSTLNIINGGLTNMNLRDYPQILKIKKVSIFPYK